MHITKISNARPDAGAIMRAVEVLKRGGTVVYPTETAYALGCDAASPAAVRKIFRIKGRDRSKPLPLIAASAAMARRYTRLDPMSASLARRFWPGPLTLVLPARRADRRTGNHLRSFDAAASNERGEMALRVSEHPIARELARRLGRPLVSTSANRSGAPARYRVSDVLADLGTAPDLVLDAGPLPVRRPSTIVKCAGDRCEVLREGPISQAALLQTLRSC